MVYDRHPELRVIAENPEIVETIQGHLSEVEAGADDIDNEILRSFPLKVADTNVGSPAVAAVMQPESPSEPASGDVVDPFEVEAREAVERAFKDAA